LGVFAYVTGSAVYSKYLLFPYIPGAGELLDVLRGHGGRWLGLFVVQHPPGTGVHGRRRAPWRLGGALGTIAVIVRQEIVLAIMGGIFVVEALSVMLQVRLFQIHQDANTAKGGVC
jgi:phospho-N-acetylmuramoyl-pentapeptide-transferase